MPYLNVNTIKKLKLKRESVSNAQIIISDNLVIQLSVLRKDVIWIIKFLTTENVSHVVKQTLFSLLMEQPAQKLNVQRDKSTSRLHLEEKPARIVQHSASLVKYSFRF